MPFAGVSAVVDRLATRIEREDLTFDRLPLRYACPKCGAWAEMRMFDHAQALASYQCMNFSACDHLFVVVARGRI